MGTSRKRTAEGCEKAEKMSRYGLIAFFIVCGLGVSLCKRTKRKEVSKPPTCARLFCNPRYPLCTKCTVVTTCGKDGKWKTVRTVTTLSKKRTITFARHGTCSASEPKCQDERDCKGLKKFCKFPRNAEYLGKNCCKTCWGLIPTAEPKCQDKRKDCAGLRKFCSFPNNKEYLGENCCKTCWGLLA